MLLGDVSEGRDNNFNLIRIVAAGAVLVSHAYPIALGEGTLEPFQAATGRSLGWIAVAVFFVISGFLITRSMDRTSTIARWGSARIMRLFPGLAVVLVLTAFLYGPFFSVLSAQDYFTAIATYTYVPRNLSLAFLQFGLPGVFDTHPLPKAINGSLWTLVHEVACYLAVLALGVFGILASRRGFGIVCAIYLAMFVFASIPSIEAHLPYRIVAFRDLSFPFVLGMALYQWRADVRLSWAVAAGLGGLSLILRTTPLFDPLFVILIGYVTFLLAYRVRGPVLAYNRLGDFSYGLYIYAFPTQQAVIALAGPQTPGANIAISLPITLGLAIVSWHLIEQPALDRRHRLADLLARGAKNNARPARERMQS